MISLDSSTADLLAIPLTVSVGGGEDGDAAAIRVSVGNETAGRFAWSKDLAAAIDAAIAVHRALAMPRQEQREVHVTNADVVAGLLAPLLRLVFTIAPAVFERQGDESEEARLKLTVRRSSRDRGSEHEVVVTFVVHIATAARAVIDACQMETTRPQRLLAPSATSCASACPPTPVGAGQTMGSESHARGVTQLSQDDVEFARTHGCAITLGLRTLVFERLPNDDVPCTPPVSTVHLAASLYAEVLPPEQVMLQLGVDAIRCSTWRRTQWEPLWHVAGRGTLEETMAVTSFMNQKKWRLVSEDVAPSL